MSESVNNKIEEAHFLSWKFTFLESKRHTGWKLWFADAHWKPSKVIPSRSNSWWFCTSLFSYSYNKKLGMDSTSDWFPLSAGLDVSLARPSAKWKYVFWLILTRLIAEHCQVVRCIWEAFWSGGLWSLHQSLKLALTECGTETKALEVLQVLLICPLLDPSPILADIVPATEDAIFWFLLFSTWNFLQGTTQ